MSWRPSNLCWLKHSAAGRKTVIAKRAQFGKYVSLATVKIWWKNQIVVSTYRITTKSSRPSPKEWEQSHILYSTAHLVPMTYICFNIWGNQESKTLVLGFNHLPAIKEKKISAWFQTPWRQGSGEAGPESCDVQLRLTQWCCPWSLRPVVLPQLFEPLPHCLQSNWIFSQFPYPCVCWPFSLAGLANYSLYMGAGDLNSGSLAFTASVLTHRAILTLHLTFTSHLLSLFALAFGNEETNMILPSLGFWFPTIQLGLSWGCFRQLFCPSVCSPGHYA